MVLEAVLEPMVTEKPSQFHNALANHDPFEPCESHHQFEFIGPALEIASVRRVETQTSFMSCANELADTTSRHTLKSDE
jgi:hypothetical protein